MNFVDMKKALYDFSLANVPSIQWVHNLQNAKLPSYPVGLITYTSITRIGKHETKQYAEYVDDIEETVQNYYQAVFRFSIYGENAQQLIFEFLNNSTLSNNRSIIKSQGLGFERFGTVVDLSFLEDSDIIQRFEVDMTFNLVMETTQLTPFIKTWEFDGDIDYPTKP